MYEQRMKDVNDTLEERVVRALERVPMVTVPEEFAARVAWPASPQSVCCEARALWVDGDADQHSRACNCPDCGGDGGGRSRCYSGSLWSGCSALSWLRWHYG